jgi:hypothetical protein
LGTKGIFDYIKDGLEQDCPVALLNMFATVEMEYTDYLGITDTVDYKLHWVTITGVNEDFINDEVTLQVLTWGGTAEISYDELWEANQSIKGINSGVLYFE